MTFPFRRKKPMTAREERKYATFIRSAEVPGPRFQSNLSLDELRAAQRRMRAIREANGGANGEI